MTRGEVAHYEREQRDLVRPQLRRADAVAAVGGVGEALGYVGYFAELIDEWAPEAHADERLYRLGSSVIDAIATGAPVDALARYFEYHGCTAGSLSVDPAVSGLRRGLERGRIDAAARGCVCAGPVRLEDRAPGWALKMLFLKNATSVAPDRLQRCRWRRAPRASSRPRIAASSTHISTRTEVRPRPQGDAAAAVAGGRRDSMVTLQQLIFKLSEFWTSWGCLLQQPLDIEMGAGTMHPETFLRVLGPKPWNVAYVQPSRRPADGRFGENPNRLFKHQQFQVILAGARRSAAALPAEPRGLRHRPAFARRALRGRQLGVAHPRGVGHRLAGALRRPGDHAVLLPAGRRRGPHRSVELTYGSSGSPWRCRMWTTSTTSSGRRANTATCGIATKWSSRVRVRTD